MLLRMKIAHHGAVDGVTGSCHQITLADGRGLLIDCGLFQGAEAGPDGAGAEGLEIRFPVAPIRALIVTHVHIDHVGRLPYLMAAGYRGPILCSPASAELLPMVLEDALKVGFTRNRRLIEQVLAELRRRIVAVPYGLWVNASGAPVAAEGAELRIRLQPAGHILGSAYAEIDADGERVVFSGDLGAPDTPLLPAPASPERADVLVLESTYGDRVHEDRSTRVQRLRTVIERALRDGGTVLIPAFSIGRTQELLYELEELFDAHDGEGEQPRRAWRDLQVVLDSPLAADFTGGYRRLRGHWDREAKQRVREGRHPLAFEQLVTVDRHEDHLRMVRHLAQSRQPAVVIAASGMCAGGRVVNYLKAMLADPRHDVLFVGYQAAGTPGRDIQRFGPRGGYVLLDGQRYDIRAGVHTIGGYSAHADRRNLIDFVAGIPSLPQEIRLVHGDDAAKRELRDALAALAQGTRQYRVWIPG
jgi:metallo-beta-lactamase family protein